MLTKAISNGRRTLSLSTAAVLLLIGCNNSDTVTGPSFVAATPTPRPAASLHGKVLGLPTWGPQIFVDVAGASITAQQGTTSLSTTSAADGSYTIHGLVAGTVHVRVFARFGRLEGTSATLTLTPGENVWDAHL